jgi:glutamate--cysteine ligase
MAPIMTREVIIDGAEVGAGAGVAVAPRMFPLAEARARLKALVEAGGRAGLARGRWGLEREGLRVEADGRPALTPHPFGPEERAITVDFAEAQAELITAPRASPEAAWAELGEAHRRLRARLGEELFWPLSLPGRWDEPERLRAAEFGGRPEDAGARAYRAELVRRHGRARQAISGVHYNFSFDAELLAALRRADGATGPEREWRDGIYFGVMRNFLRHQHVFNALWGMSPPEDEAFWQDLRSAAGGESRAEADRCADVISSVRLSPLGYGLAPDVAEALGVDFSSLGAYVERLGAAVQRGGVLAHEREFYSPVRPKTVAGGAGEEKNEAGASLRRLAREGVGYLEFRVFDLDPFEANGVGLEALRFFHVLVLASLFRPSEPIGAGERAELAERWRWSTLCGGRWCECRPSPGAVGEREILPLLEFMAEIAEQLPTGYAAAVAAARERWAGRRDRPLDRWRSLVAATPGGALAAGLALARAHAAEGEAATADTPDV